MLMMSYFYGNFYTKIVHIKMDLLNLIENIAGCRQLFVRAQAFTEYVALPL